MICCINCFKDVEVRNIIQSLSNIGNCDICHANQVYIYNTEKDDNLTPLFNGLLEVYAPLSNLSEHFPREKTRLLKDELYRNWSIFNIDEENIYRLIREICFEKYEETPELFDGPIAIPAIVDDTYLKEKQLFGLNDWDKFAKSIKEENRFHTDVFNTNILKNYIRSCIVHLKKGELYFRARRSSNENGFELCEMGAPPKEKAGDGRANPKGISYLYLANDIGTAIYEIRAGVLDYISVGTFKLEKNIKLIDLTSLSEISPFYIEGQTQYAINKEHLRKIGDEIARPINIQDDPLDYLPTQYIVDFIKSLPEKYDGIKYHSTRKEGGYNLAIFDDNLFKCIDVAVYKVTSLSYRGTFEN